MNRRIADDGPRRHGSFAPVPMVPALGPKTTLSFETRATAVLEMGDEAAQTSWRTIDGVAEAGVEHQQQDLVVTTINEQDHLRLERRSKLAEGRRLPKKAGATPQHGRHATVRSRGNGGGLSPRENAVSS